MQVIGLCRFSYPAVAGYKIAHATTAEPCDFLYYPTRVKIQFRHLETTCVPALAAQTDPDFLFVIVIEDNLLDRYNMCLLELTAGLSQVVIVAPPPEPYRKVMQSQSTMFSCCAKQPLNPPPV